MMLFVMFALFASSYSYPSGAPAEACADIYPIGHAENAASQDLSNNPFQLDLSDLDHSRGGSVYYVQGRTYTLTLSGSGGEQFRGFLVQARTVADGSPVGAFSDNGENQALSSCTPAESAITHPNQDLKSSVVLSWTAPPESSGQLHILYAVVGEFNQSVGSSIFWAPATTAVILPCDTPFYHYQGNCVESCPLQHIGNYTSGFCQPFPSNYIISLNATQYNGSFNSETPVNTTAFYMQLSINTNTMVLSNIVEVTFSFFQTQLVQDLFEFEHGGDEDQYVATDQITSVNADTSLVDASIILVALPNVAYYPVDIDMTVSVHLIYFASSDGNSIAVESTTSKAVGSIVMAPGPCGINVCHNGGTCMETNRTHFICECPHEFTGEACSEAVDACQMLEPCVNGTCHASGVMEYTCTCYSGYTGNDCSEAIDACQLLEPCVNGTCHASGVMEYTCTCHPGYTGNNCSEHICKGVECNNGVCMSMEGEEDFVCNCDVGYTGNLCDEVIADCYLKGCNGNGNCTNVCECFPGWTGVWCETKLPCEPNPCANNGVCNDNNGTATCACTPTWTGTYCGTWIGTSVCDESPCFNNGTCSVDCQGNRRECLSNETDKLYRCLCVAGFTGDTCNEDDPSITFCQSYNCVNSGTCVEEYGPQVSCVCAHGFTGPTCNDETLNSDNSCSQSVFRGEVLIAIIIAVTCIIIVGIIGTLITIVQVVHYRTKYTAKANKTQLPSDLNREMNCRVFSNTDMNTGIYFDGVDGSRRSPVLGSESLTVSTSPPIVVRHSEQPLLNSHRHESVSSQQSRDTLEHSSGWTFSNDTMSQMTAASDYEQPVYSMRRHFASQNSHRQNFSSSQYETVY